MYKFSKNGILRLVDNAMIPIDNQNSDYQSYLIWVEQGGQTQESDKEEVYIPNEVTKFQGKSALLHFGLLKKTEDLILNSDEITKLAWADVVTFRRDSPLLLNIANALELTKKQIDDLFIYAETVK